ncbi:MAG: ECF transporter S component [archaeon]|nr:ECF transporter S component [archaeon]
MSSERLVKTTSSQSTALKTSMTGIMAAVNCIATMIVSLYIPATEGFFNIGEFAVYLTAILFGPYIGALSGGIGPMMADILLGYPHYAPGTLVIKGLEGFVVGYLYNRLKNKESMNIDKKIAGLFVASLIIIGIILYLLIGQLNYDAITGFILNFDLIGAEIWIVIPIVLLAIIIFLVIKVFEKETSNKIISMLFGGVILVVGYLFYCTLILGNIQAYVEIPYNIMQCVIGIMIALPLIDPIKKMLNI